MKKEIRINGPYFEAYLNGERICVTEDLVEAQDELEDAFHEAMNDGYDYYCEFCQEWFMESECQHRIEDQTFTAPYGSIFVLGGDVASVPVCPICKDDMEKIK